MEFARGFGYVYEVEKKTRTAWSGREDTGKEDVRRKRYKEAAGLQDNDQPRSRFKPSTIGLKDRYCGDKSWRRPASERR